MFNIFSGIKWAPGAPGGGRQQNNVGIRPLAKDFTDLGEDTKVCVSCEINKSTVFELRGACEDSFMETEFFPTMCGPYIGFLGNMQSIW